MRTIDHFYSEFRAIIRKNNSQLLHNFDEVVREAKHPKEVFLWLDKQLQSGKISSDIEPLLTDFFGCIH